MISSVKNIAFDERIYHIIFQKCNLKHQFYEICGGRIQYTIEPLS